MTGGAFTWGVSTSAYQIEGGRGPGLTGESIWDRFAAAPGATHGGVDGARVSDHYHRVAEDVALMERLGIDAYRFSIGWTRVIPDGSGGISTAGLGFYDRLVDLLLDHGITPYPTLYHWDLPQPLQDRGGWPDRATVDGFVHLTDTVTGTLGDRVVNWITHNEPWVAAMLGHMEGTHAPGLRDWGAALAAGHHLLLSHGRAASLIRANVPGARVGIALDCRPAAPATAADEAAARHFDGFRNRWFFDPVFGRGYPQDVLDEYIRRGRITGPMPGFVLPGDLEEIAAPLDFLGLNYYTSLRVRSRSDENEGTGVGPGPDPPHGHTEMGWPITPEALTEFLARIHAEYRPPEILITENGASFSDGPAPDGAIHDDRRIDYLRSHIEAVGAARTAGVPVNGYFVWSLLDNLEWALGFTQRFGLVWVDFDTGARIPKDSYHWFRRLIAQRAVPG
jgi:beta-glucosidase